KKKQVNHMVSSVEVLLYCVHSLFLSQQPSSHTHLETWKLLPCDAITPCRVLCYHTFSGGKVLCEKAGGALATPRNVAENTALKDIVKRKSEYAFLAINDIQTEGRFVYLDGTPVNYKNWNRGEPNDLDNEDCAILHEDGLWNDIDCARKALIICEI
uniref:C-type lectin domain-containing protein n=1 Tax=Varanus komodoensis TaxID=61221 RepID=A0A8D2JHN5_VARKO